MKRKLCPQSNGLKTSSAYKLGCRCDICVTQRQEYLRSWRIKNPAAQERAKEKARIRFREAYSQDPKKLKARRKAWIKKNPEKYQQVLHAWKQKNPDKVKATDHRKYEKNKVKKKRYAKRYLEQNRSKVYLRLAKRRALKAQAFVSSRTSEVKEWRLFLGELRTWLQSLGYKTAIDHIVPLTRGGLEVPENLRLIPSTENSRKHNRLDSELNFEVTRLSPSWEEWTRKTL